MDQESNTSGNESGSSTPVNPALNPADRPATVDRRTGLDRRALAKGDAGYTGPERRRNEADTGLELHRGPGRRRSDDRRSAEEGEMTGAQFEFVMAVETYKKVNKKMYPTWTEILEVFRQLGYRKVMERSIKLENVPEARIYKLGDDDQTDDEREAA